MNKIFALVDCNSFYCSCERLFRPDLINKPVGVLSNNDGCFVSLTRELKALGVPMGEPYFKVRELCDRHKVAVFSANFSLYTNISDRVMMNLIEFAPEVELYSVDEAFLDLSTLTHLNLNAYATQIKQTVERNTGIPVSIGIGPSKTLAKVANHIAKNFDFAQGVYSVMPLNNREFALEKTLTSKVWGIGRRKSLKLKSLNIRTAKELRDFDNDALIQKLFTKVTRMTVDELRGHSRFDLELEPKPKKEIISSRTFGAPVYDIETLKESVASYASLACEKLRAQKSSCSIVEVYIRTNPHKDIPQYYAYKAYRFQAHTSDTRKVIHAAWIALQKIYKPGFEYRKALVKLSDIRSESQSQLSLFEETDSPNSRILMETMDKINHRDGPHTLKSAACGVDNHSWRMKQALKSRRFVTGWSEICWVN
ncbi:MAG: Y-family DNA polymerase [Halobacteriovoraceae bacterium]|nr:Y-family DNA polymerase [Halobacteriovoraceae bacterium]MCB9095376.1 Y-family DNA polymerase [Halobacteriovoraceae bacterium]